MNEIEALIESLKYKRFLFITNKAAGKALGVHHHTIKHMVNAGIIKSIPIIHGRRIHKRITKSAFVDYLHQLNAQYKSWTNGE